MIYLDNNATTRVAPEVFEAMIPFLQDSFGNPSAAYSFGQISSKAIESARESVAKMIGAEFTDEIVFTSGGTESDNWAILGALETAPKQKHIVTTTVEHEAVRKLCDKLELGGTSVTRIEVDENGSLDLDHLRTSLNEETAVVSVMMANNETGILFPVDQIAEIVKENSNALFHVDGVNAAGKIPIDLKNSAIDLFSISGHKFHAPKGIGALYIRRGVDIPSIAVGGGQENGRRAGTEAVHQIAAIGAAADLVSDLSKMNGVAALRDRLENEILTRFPESKINGTGDRKMRLPNTLSISFENINGETILAKLDNAGICVSTGSACNSADHRASPVLQAMNIPYQSAMGAIRFSLGRYNTKEDIDITIENLEEIINSLRSLSLG
ncbi:MAG: aminotransferase class V-fold PLP-dependent enzyme [Pyrinomonadaceae bacterium]|nr:aminotransferase class V-fold PLP-dependent enzyme [Pyrinomonadaceae bacterium]